MNEHDFSKHEITFYQMRQMGDKKVGCEFLEFRQLGSVFGKLQFHTVGRNLFVTGDYGSAVYTWPQPITLEQVARFGLTYFAEKCTASEVGIPFRQWYPDEARDFVTEWENVCGDSSDSFREAFDDAMVNHDSAFKSAWKWSIFLGDHGAELFGDGWEEYVDAGYGIHLRCQLHHEGIVAAVGQLDAWRQEQVSKPGYPNVVYSVPRCIMVPFDDEARTLELTVDDLLHGVDFETARFVDIRNQAAALMARKIVLSHGGRSRALKNATGPVDEPTRGKMKNE